ncbi:MAG TPA: PilN domain-containing protein, partial [Phycisphaerales bacterium]|nr:PilN domain-containing protein [Phycisphaerales bacterium]
ATMLVILITHSKIMLNKARLSLYDTQIAANKVIETESKIAELRGVLEANHAATREYERAAFPLESSSIIATIVNRMPVGMTLQQLTIDAGQRVATNSPRSKGVKDKSKAANLPRMLTAEVGGVAPSDQEIAQFVNALENNPPFSAVSLDFSKTSIVRGTPAREFRVSFSINLDAHYTLVPSAEAVAAVPEESTDGK